MSEHDEWVSKTQKKKEMDDLQDLGVQLTKLSVDTLKKMPLPEDLLDALKQHKKITANGALKRQLQFIGRLMRDVDPEPIEAFLARLKGDNAAHNAYLQRLELLRTQLIADDQALNTVIADCPDADISYLRTLVRNARKEQAQEKSPKAFKALFQALKETYDQQQSSQG
ncbi:MAG: ribosome biogenesis factor YjgA [Neisseriaceae bacterium]|nr:DUF615 domain-containing protein [Neisseriaceae bacterium]